MTRELFLNKIKEAKTFVNTARESMLLKRSISLGNKHHKFPSGAVNLVICMEELSELQKEVSKLLRNKGDKIALTEEIADVLIGMEYVKIITGIEEEDINRAINVKLDRLEERDKDLED